MSGKHDIHVKSRKRSDAMVDAMRVIVDEPELAKRGPATVLFTDLCGYTSLSLHLDPEELQGVMEQLFGGIARIVDSYEARIEKLVGDSALIIFGVPRTNEDDAIRAIKAALEIHDFVARLGESLRSVTGRSLSMHSSVGTGVIVVSEKKGRAGESALGSTINLASRLLDIAGPDEIVCTEETYVQTQGYFDFEDLGLRPIKGHAEDIHVFRVQSPRTLPVTAHRLWGARSRLIGRDEELDRLSRAVTAVQHGHHGMVVIRGDAGTGKSRLVDELKASLDRESIGWIETSARSYSRNTPYDPFTELLAREWGIQDDDSVSELKRKIEQGTAVLAGAPDDAAECAGILFGLELARPPTSDSASWKRQFYALMRAFVSTHARRRPTVLYVGDLHWADPSSLELLRYLVASCDAPVLHVVTFRPGPDLFEGTPPPGLRVDEIRLNNLSSSEATEMLASLLEADEVPASLRVFLQDKAEGNPFYLEELVNSLVETGTLVRRDEAWIVNRDLESSGVPLNVLGMVAARLDRLDRPTRRVLLEAAVLGRSFLADLLGRITDDPAYMSRLDKLQKLDLIRVRNLEPGLEYEFKHAMIQDAAYAELLLAERRALHSRVASELESMFADRLPEFYETLATHYRLGGDTDRAVDCLVKSADKCFRRHAVEESYEFYRQAYEMLAERPRSPEEDRLLLEIIHRWGYVIYDEGNMRDLERLLETHEDLAESVGTTSEHAMYQVVYGIALNCRERFAEALKHERRGLEMALALDDAFTAACARVWLANTLAEMGRLDESIEHSQKAIPVVAADPFWSTEALCALGFGYWTRGDASATFEVAERLLELARSRPSVRALAAGLWVKGEACLADGDYATAADCFEQSIEAAPEPWPSTHPRVYLSIALIQLGRYEEARPHLAQVIELQLRARLRADTDSLGDPPGARQVRTG